MKKVLMMGACALALAACEGNRPMTGTDAGGRVDSGSSGTDSGTPRPDSGGSGDDCEASGDDAISTVGCNGGVLGAARTANDFGGLCTVGDDTNPAGSCTNTNGVCWGAPGGQGICVTTCTPTAANYVSTGGCPTGSRCFDLTDAVGVALCFPDCNSASDCASDNCDGEGSCVDPEEEPAPDGGTGTPDAGTPAPDGGSGG